ncbi:CLUMA_CG006682, isoform A [Clunio marinus]|uniref:CLUMA_CG006682, isoform A n=1 Tax=Clunio marinus TaxID=568069 RepID=A0A1J1I053_9DIPT|nr:CLUMA_CG006682, isoform A [Clunio marinus]
MKHFIVILLAIKTVENATMSWGNLQPRNLQIFDQLFHQTRENNFILGENFVFSSPYGALITAIHVTDLTFQQDGGTVRILSGGIGYNYVKLQLISECGKQLLLNVEIFGS